MTPQLPPTVDDAGRIESLLEPISRRGFFARLAVTAGAGAVAACSRSETVNRPAGVKNMTDEEIVLFRRVIAVFIPAEEAWVTPVDKVPLMQNIDRMFSRFDPKVRRDLGIGLKLFAYGSFFLGWHFTPFTKLDAAAAADYCARWQSGSTLQRGVFSALKQLIYLSYWRIPETWPAIGYEGPVSSRYGIAALGNAPLPKD